MNCSAGGVISFFKGVVGGNKEDSVIIAMKHIGGSIIAAVHSNYRLCLWDIQRRYAISQCTLNSISGNESYITEAKICSSYIKEDEQEIGIKITVGYYSPSDTWVLTSYVVELDQDSEHSKVKDVLLK